LWVMLQVRTGIYVYLLFWDFVSEALQWADSSQLYYQFLKRPVKDKPAIKIQMESRGIAILFL